MNEFKIWAILVCTVHQMWILRGPTWVWLWGMVHKYKCQILHTTQLQFLYVCFCIAKVAILTTFHRHFCEGGWCHDERCLVCYVVPHALQYDTEDASSSGMCALFLSSLNMTCSQQEEEYSVKYCCTVVLTMQQWIVKFASFDCNKWITFSASFVLWWVSWRVNLQYEHDHRHKCQGNFLLQETRPSCDSLLYSTLLYCTVLYCPVEL